MAKKSHSAHTRAANTRATNTRAARTRAAQTAVQKNRSPYRSIGVAIIAMISTIALVGVLLAGLNAQGARWPGSSRLPIPDDVPPAVGAPVPTGAEYTPGRSDQTLEGWAESLSSPTKIPLAALKAYGAAELRARELYPNCNLAWNTLAGIGWNETRHGTYDGSIFGGSTLNDEGTSEPAIIGPQLNGESFAEVVDSDKGELDGDKEYDRAVGPMQFIPQSWSHYGVDANDDGHTDPQNIYDAAAAAAALLCDFNRDLATPEGWTSAVRNYNQSDRYVRDVRDAAANYALKQSPR